ncbi:hypothetical protein B9Z55_012290 [Caenorhabditis nigoni]|nr:hypothetical protein B9Z55_012290 [Caenorhabditis nigoni]
MADQLKKMFGKKESEHKTKMMYRGKDEIVTEEQMMNEKAAEDNWTETTILTPTLADGSVPLQVAAEIGAQLAGQDMPARLTESDRKERLEEMCREGHDTKLIQAKRLKLMSDEEEKEEEEKEEKEKEEEEEEVMMSLVMKRRRRITVMMAVKRMRRSMRTTMMVTSMIAQDHRRDTNCIMIFCIHKGFSFFIFFSYFEYRNSREFSNNFSAFFL